MTDCSGEVTEEVQTLTWTVDTEAPSITTAVDATKALGCNPSDIAFDSPAFDGGCSEAVAVDGYPQTTEVMEDGCNRSQTRTWRMTDCSGEVTEEVQTLTWTVDTEAPSITTAVDATKALGCNPSDIAFDSPAFDGGCSEAVAVDGYPQTTEVMEDGCNRSQTRTWRMTDCSGEVTETSQTLNWTVDTEAPSITTAVDATKALGCNPSDIAFDSPAFDGGCSEAVAVDGYPQTTEVMEDGCNRSQTRTWRMTDCSGEVTETSQTLNWTVDTEAPSITTAVDATKALGCNPSDIAFDSPAFDGGCSEAVAVDGYPQTTEVMEDGCNRSQTRTWRMTDCSGEVTETSQTLNWTVDTEAPSITTAVDATKALGCNPSDIAFDSPAFDGGCSEAVAVDGYPQTTEVMEDGCNRSQTRTWRMTDCSGEVTETSQTLNWTVDTEAPSISTAVDATKALGCNPSDIAFDSPAFDGGCSEAVAVDGYPQTTEVMEDGCNRSQTRTWRMTDCSGEVTETSQTLNWTVDTEAPTLSCAPNKPVECGETLVWDDPTASDNCGEPTVEILSTDASMNACGIGTVTRTWQATDCGGNTSNCAQVITIQDTTNPSIACAADKSIECDEPIVWDEPTASDNCGTPTVTISSTDANMNACGNGTVTRTWEAKDCTGNATTCEQVITITDTTPPMGDFEDMKDTVGCVEDIYCSDNLDIMIEEIASNFVDNCGDVVVELIDDSMLMPCTDGFLSRTYTFEVRDQCGNVAGQYDISLCTPCQDFCTFTRGFYGNRGGIQGGLTTTEIIDILLDHGNHPITIGDGSDCGFTISDTDCVIDILPGGGPSKPIDANFDGDLNCNEEFTNTLVGQLLTVKLNVRYNYSINGKQDMGSFSLEDACFNVSSGVFSELDNLGIDPTIDGLLELADRFLASNCTDDDFSNGLGGEITAILGSINEYWHECSIEYSCAEFSLLPLSIDAEEEEEEVEESSEKESKDFSILPNPVDRNTVQLKLEDYMDKNISIYVYNQIGELIFTENIKSLDTPDRALNLTNWQNGMYVVHIISGLHSSSKKMIVAKLN